MGYQPSLPQELLDHQQCRFCYSIDWLCGTNYRFLTVAHEQDITIIIITSVQLERFLVTLELHTQHKEWNGQHHKGWPISK